MDKIANAKKILLKLKAKQTRPYRFTTRFTEEEVKLIFKYAKLHNHDNVVSYIRQCIADNVRLTKEATTY